MRHALVSLIGAAVLSACQSLPSQTPGLGPGAEVILHRALTIPAERASVYVQGGRITNDVDPYYPHCRFEVKSLAPASRTVEPDTFLVERIYYEETDSAAGPGMQIFGGLSVGVGTGGVSAGNGIGYITYATVMRLHSPRQPQVLALTCQDWQDPIDAKHLTLRQIRETLGMWFSIEPPPAG